jgi:hypothetical protein
MGKLTLGKFTVITWNEDTRRAVQVDVMTEAEAIAVVCNGAIAEAKYLCGRTEVVTGSNGRIAVTVYDNGGNFAGQSFYFDKVR